MKKLLGLLILTLLLSYTTASSEDIGVKDTVKFVCDSLIVGQSVPIEFHVFNDSPLRVVYTGFLVTGANVVCDSIIYIGRLEDPNVLDFRFSYFRNDSLYLLPQNLFKDNLPIGDENIINIYFTAQEVGAINFDSLAYRLPDQWGLMDASTTQLHKPYFSPQQILIKEATPIPVLNIDSNLTRMLNTEVISIGFNTFSPETLETNVAIKSIHSVHDSTQIPTTLPVINMGLDSTISWSPGLSDIGVWEVTVEACNTLGYCVERNIQIQVLSNNILIPEFTSMKFENVINMTALTIGNFDNDREYELAATGIPSYNTKSFAILDIDLSSESYTVPYSSYIKYTAFAPISIYKGSSNYQNLHYFSYYLSSYNTMYSVDPYNGGYDTVSTNIDFVSRITSVGRINNDNKVDFVVGYGSDVSTLINETGNYLLTNSYRLGSTVLSLNVADFNHDHFDDIAISTLDGFYVYINDKTGNFSQSDYHPQEFGGADLEITNQGTDFNNDHNYDILVGAPSVGGTHSEIIIYTGNPDGTFNKYFSKRVIGQTTGCAAGDINNDGFIDVLYINSSKKYLGILFGDESGAFENEIQYPIDGLFPYFIKTFDIDLDGDLDIVVSTFDNKRYNELFVYENQTNSIVESSEIQIDLSGTGDVQLTAPSGKYLDRNASTFATGSSAYWQSENGGLSDRKYVVKEVEQGEYSLIVKRADTTASAFLIEATVDQKKYRFNNGEESDKSEYRFRFTPSGNSPVFPESGGFTHDSSVTFIWNNQGTVNFQLSSDLDFNNLLIDTTLETNQYSFTNLSFATDTVTLYWRYFTGSPDLTVEINVANLVSPVPTDITDPQGQLPTEFTLSDNYPNPFNPTTQINYTIPKAEDVSLLIYNLNGRLVKTLVDNQQTAGNYSVTWNGRNEGGKLVASGIYLYKLMAGDFTQSKKMILMK